MSNTLSNNDVLSKVRGFYTSLSSSEKKVAGFVLEHYQETIRMTLADVAQESGVSDATVLRFCRSIGYSNWLEFKINLTQMLPNLPKSSMEILLAISPGKSSWDPSRPSKTRWRSSTKAVSLRPWN